MFLICISHTYNASGFSNVLSTNVGDVFTVMIKNSGWLGDIIFICCSVFFLYDKEKTLNFRKVFVYYVSSALIFFTFLGIFLLAKIPVPHNILIDTLDTYIVHHYWFVVNYIIYMLLFPLLAFIIDKCNKKVHLGLVIVAMLFALANLITRQLDYFECGLLITFYTMFVIITFGKKYGYYLFIKDGKENRTTHIIILVVCLLLWFGSTLVCSAVYPKIGLADVEMTNINYIHSPIIYVLGIDLFLLFKNLEIKTSKVINYVSSLSLTFYLMHHNKYTELIIDPYINSFVLNGHEAFRPLLILGFGSLIFVGGVVASIIYNESIGRLVKLIGKYIPNIKLEKKIVEENS